MGDGEYAKCISELGTTELDNALECGWERHALFIHWSFGLFLPLECKFHEGRDPVGLVHYWFPRTHYSQFIKI